MVVCDGDVSDFKKPGTGNGQRVENKLLGVMKVREALK